jgi:hypothetical protein
MIRCFYHKAETVNFFFLNCKLVDYERTVKKNWGVGGRKRDREKEIIKRYGLLVREDIRYYSVCACFYQNMCTHIHQYD